MWLDRESNPQPFTFMGRGSNQMSHTHQGPAVFLVTSPMFDADAHSSLRTIKL